MIVAWIASALAAPPEGVDPDDVFHWEAGSRALLDGPPGCWELSGQLDLTLSGYVPASRWTRPERRDHKMHGTFSGRIDGGTWTSFTYELDDGEDDMTVPLFPMTGRISPDVVKRLDEPSESTLQISSDGNGEEEAVNTLRRTLDAIDPETETAYAEWSDGKGAVRLLQDIPFEGSGRDTVVVETLFPNGGPATSLDVTFPRRVKVGDALLKVTVFDGQMHLRGQQVGDLVMPALESLSVGMGALGLTGAWEQKLTYQKAQRCAASAAPAPASAPETPPPPAPEHTDPG
ncbi:MAG: hypothetical protein H6738_19255 [Alphaproteobacteria bacterium]|nr:hypothetical protein [Alphaproteobacteria bacterium]MCB9698927.1 hypothetical protein [Alphaproteobacteria bacterium]